MAKKIVIVLAVLLCVCQEQVFGRPPQGIQRVPREIENAEKVHPPQGIQRVRRGIENVEKVRLPSGIQRVRREIENAEQVPPPSGIRRVQRGVNLENPQQKSSPPESGLF